MAISAIKRFRKATRAILPRVSEALRQNLLRQEEGARLSWEEVVEQMGPLTIIESQADDKYERLNAKEWAALISESIDYQSGEWGKPEFERVMTKYFTRELMDKFSASEQMGLLQLFPGWLQTEWQDALPKATVLGPVCKVGKAQKKNSQVSAI